MKRLLVALAGIGLLLAATVLLNQAAPGQWRYALSGSEPAPVQPLDLILLTAAGLALFAWALAGGGASVRPFGVGTGASRPAAAGWILVALSMGLSLAAALRFSTLVPQRGAWALHGGALLALAAGVTLVARRQGREWSPSPRFWRTLLWLALLTLAALAVRLVGNGRYPAGIWYDEAMNALVARRMLAGPLQFGGNWPLYLPGTFHTAHFNYLLASAFDLLSEEIRVARAVSGLFGALLVPATWLAARELFRDDESGGAGVAWGAALLAAGAAWSLNLSRIAVNYIATPLFAVAATGLLLHALRTGRLWAYAGAGLAVGLGLNFYTSFRLFLPVLPLFVAAALLAHRRDEGGVARAWAGTWRGLALAAVVALVLGAPLIGFAAANPSLAFERTGDTFLFTNVAQDARLNTLWHSLRAHLLMFNVAGDPNGRHNLPGRPLLDPLLGALFLPGLALSLWRMREPRHLLLLLWLGFGLLGGVLTLAFEAPQSLRSNGALPAALLIALVPVAALQRLWRRAAPYPSRRTQPFVVSLLLAPSLAWNLWGYFQVQRTDFAVWNAFSAPETAMARTLAPLDPERTDGWVIVDSANHPTVEWLAPQWSGRQRVLLSTDPMPMLWPEGRDAWVFLNADNEAQVERLALLYPNAEVREVRPPFADTVSATQVHLTAADIEGLRGLTFSLARETFDDSALERPSRFENYPAVHTARVTTIAADWNEELPLEEPFVAQWSGALRTGFGEHTLVLAAPARTALYLDESLVLSSTAGLVTTTVSLADGPHALRLVAEGAPGEVSLLWVPPPAAEEETQRIPPEVPLIAAPAPIPVEVLLGDPAAAAGLLGDFVPLSEEVGARPLLDVAAEELAGEESAYAVVSPAVDAVFHIAPVEPPVAVEWTGILWAPAAGEYLFAATAADATRVTLDGQVVVETVARNTTAEGKVRLEAGMHAIEVLFASRGPHVRVALEWAPPGSGRVPLPGYLLVPPQGDTGAAAARFEALNPWLLSTLGVDEPADQPAPVEIQPELVLDGLFQPVSVQVGQEGRIFVAEAAAGRVTVLNPDGSAGSRLDPGAEALEEPSALAKTLEGELLVLDAGRGALLRYDGEGKYIERLPVPPPYLSRSRGLAVGADGRIWVAATATSRVVMLSPAGNVLREWQAAAGPDVQPVSVLALPAANDLPRPGTIVAAVLGANVGLLYDEQGTALAEWTLAPANSLEAPHFAPGPDGSFYVTVPEAAQIEQRTAEGTLLAVWQLPHEPLLKPVGLARTDDGSLLVTDTTGGALWRVVLP